MGVVLNAFLNLETPSARTRMPCRGEGADPVYVSRVFSKNEQSLQVLGTAG